MERELQAEEQEFGQYQLRRLLGEGGFGQVYEAWDPKLQRSIAIKRLKPHMLSSRPDNLLDEARLAASLRHPAFVKIFSIDGDAESHSIIMEYVDGSTLRQLVQGQPLPEAKVLDIAAQIAAAMEEAHGSKLIHGDIKPANLMLEASGNVRIMDFGLARRMDPQATESVVIDETQGTIAYLAPELLTGARQSEQSDVYALGVVMYEMVTGARPFPQLSGLALAAAHIQSSSDLWPFPPETSPAMVKLVREMTARDPKRRIASMNVVHIRVDELRGGPSVHNASAAWFPKLGKLFALRTRRITLGVICVVLLVVTGGQAAMSTPWFQRHTPFFSEAAAMQTGLAHLKKFDRYESIDVAVNSFNAILERRPDHAAAAAGLSLAYSLRHVGDGRDPAWLNRADASAQLAIKLNDQLAMAYAAQGTVRLAQGKFNDALQLASHALRLDPMNAFGLAVKGDALTQLRRFSEAKEALSDAIRIHPKEQILENLLGKVYFEQKDYVAAEQAFLRSIKIEPDAVGAYANLSYTLVMQGRSDEALQVLQQGLQIRPSGQLYSNLGAALFNRGDYVGAAQAFERAVSSATGRTNDYVRWANLADTLRWIPGREQESLKCYQQAVALLRPLLDASPSNATLLSRMGLYSARLGEREAALGYAGKALTTLPATADVKFRSAMVFEIAGDRDGALTLLRSAIALGYPVNQISAEPDLIALRRDPRYLQSTIEKAK